MNLHLLPRRAAAGLLAAALLAGAVVLPAGAADSAAPSTPKEEIVYANLSASGEVTGVYVVSQFEGVAGQTITDYGDYTALRNMTTTDPLDYQNGVLTLTPAQDGKIYCEGTLAEAQLPWLFDLTYTLDGAEVSPEELAGKSGALVITLSAKENPACEGDFFDQYALQINLTLDTHKAENITAPGATVANVGSDKQLTFLVLPGQETTLTVSADVTDFALDPISINGVRMRLSLDSGALTDSIGALTDGTTQLNDGAQALKDGIDQVKAGLDALNAQSPALTGGSAQVRSALTQLQGALAGVSASTDQLDLLLDGSAQIRDGLHQLNEGAAQLESQLSYEAYKEILAQNGLDLDELAAGNDQAIQTLNTLASFLPSCLRGQIDQIILLLEGNRANLGAIQTYLDAVNEGAQALSDGAATLDENYAVFDAGIRQLAATLTDMVGNLSLLTDAINTLAGQYPELDNGISAYTGAVGQLQAGAAQLAEGAAQLAAGTQELYTQTNGLGENDQLNSLLSMLTDEGQTESFVSAENTQVEAVQFALQTEGISPEAAPAEQEPAAAPLNFWQKLLKLFGLYKED